MLKKSICSGISVRYVFVPSSKRLPIGLVTLSDKQQKKMDNLATFNKELIQGNYKIFSSKQPNINSSSIDKPQSSINLLKDPLSDRISNFARELINDDDFLAKYLIVRKDWNPVVDNLLAQEERLLQLSSAKIGTIFSSAIYNLNWVNILKLDQFFCRYYGTDLHKFNPKNYDCLFSNIGQLEPKRSEKVLHGFKFRIDNDPSFDNYLPVNKINELLERYALIAKSQDSQSQNRILHYCLNYVCKLYDIKSVNKILTLFKSRFHLLPNRTIYSKLILFCNNLKLYDKATNLFDTMKFLSMEHQPDINAYNAILHVCEQTKDYPKALDLLQEMKEKNLVPNGYTISKIVKLLAKSSQNNISSEGKKEMLRLIAWKLLLPTLNKNKLSSIENIMSLAAYDGDVNLCRALYFQYTMKQFVEIQPTCVNDQIAWSKAFNPILFNYLLLAYSNWQNYKIPLMTMFAEGDKYRNDLLNEIDYIARSHQDCSIVLPMIPLMEINNPNDILLESNALWHFHLNIAQTTKDYLSVSIDWKNNKLLKIKQNSSTVENFKSKLFTLLKEAGSNEINFSIFNYKCLNTYLTIPIKLGSLEEFEKRLDTYTIDITDLNEIFEKLYKDPTDEKLQNELIQSKHKLLVNCWTYELMMKAAIKFKNSNLAQRTWKMRGKFRMTNIFLNLPKNERVGNDSKFAKITLDFFVETREFQDALKVVISSKYFVDWKYQDVKNLYTALAELEDEDSLYNLKNAISKKNRIKKLDKEIEELSI